MELNKPDSVLYTNAINWIAAEFGSKTYALNDQNQKIAKEFTFEMLCTVKGMLGIKAPLNYTVLMDVTIEFKPNKYRYRLTNFILIQNNETTTTAHSLEFMVDRQSKMVAMKKRSRIIVEDIFAELDKETKTFIENMKQGIAYETVPDDTW